MSRNLHSAILAIVLFSLSTSSTAFAQIQDWTDGSYAKSWKVIDSLSEIQEYDRASKETEIILRIAGIEKNVAQVIKAHSYIAGYKSILSENKSLAPIEYLASVKRDGDASQNALLELYMAAAIKNYFIEHVSNGPAADTLSGKKNAIASWSATDFEQAITKHLDNAVDPELYNLGTNAFTPLFDSIPDRKLHTTLLELVVDKALDIASHDKFSQNDISSTFTPIEDFLKMGQPSEVSSLTDYKRKWVGTLLKLHHDNNDSLSILYWDLNRLKNDLKPTIKSHYDYQTYLTKLAHKNRLNEGYSTIGHMLAEDIYQYPLDRERANW